jgi:hypothetical protein
VARVAGALLAVAGLGVLMACVRPGSTLLDFRDTYYIAAHNALHGGSPYAVSSYIYPPPFAVLLAPVAELSLHHAQQLWYALSLAMIVAAATVVARLVPHVPVPLAVGGTLLLFAGFGPLREGLRQGQAESVLLLLIGAGLLLARKEGDSRRDLAAGLCLGAAAVLKVYPAIILLYFAWTCRWRLLAGAGAAVAALMAVSVAVLGPSGIGGYVTALATQGTPAFEARSWSFGASGFLYRLFTDNPSSFPLVHVSPSILRVLLATYVLALAVGGTYLAARRWRLPAPAAHLAVVWLMLMADPLLQVHHLQLLLVVLVEPLAAAVRTVARSGRGAAAWLLAVSVLAVPAVLALADLRTSRHTIVLLTIAIAVAVGIAGVRALRLPWTRIGPAHGILALVIVYVFTASPALMNMATWWGEPMSAAHVIAGEGQFYLLLLLGAVSVVVLRGTAPRSAAGMSTARPLLDGGDEIRDAGEHAGA